MICSLKRPRYGSAIVGHRRVWPTIAEFRLAVEEVVGVEDELFVMLIERAVALTESDVIELDDLPAAVNGDHAAILSPSLNRNETLRAWGSRYARIVVDRCGGNKRKACRVLGISYHTLQAYLRYRAGNAEPGRPGNLEMPGEPIKPPAEPKEETAALG